MQSQKTGAESNPLRSTYTTEIGSSEWIGLFLRVLVVPFGVVAARAAAARARRLAAGRAPTRRGRASRAAGRRLSTGIRALRSGLVRLRLRAGRLVGRLFHGIKKC